MIDAAVAHQAGQHDRGGGTGKETRQPGIVLIRNDSGADRARFDVLGIAGAVQTPTENLQQFQSRLALKGVTPSSAAHTGKFVILLEPIRKDGFGLACIDGLCIVQIELPTGVQTAGKADVKDGACSVLQPNSSGAAQVLWLAGSSGTVWAIVRLSAPGGSGGALKFAKITAKTGSAPPYVYSGTQVEHDGSGDLSASHWLPVSGGDVLNWNLINLAELAASATGLAPQDVDAIVGYWPMGTHFAFVASGYRGTY